MKLSNTWFALILIVSALLLSGESQNTNPSPSVIGKPNESGSLVQQPTTNHPSPVAITATPQTPKQTPRSNDSSDSSNSDSGVTLFLTIVMVAATVAVAIFNGQLVGITDQMREVTERSLRSDRPYLVVESVGLVNFQPVSHKPANPVTAVFALRNWGKGAAVEVGIRMRLAVVEMDIPIAIGEVGPTREQTQPTLNDVDLCWPIGTRDRTIPVGPKTDLYEVVLNRMPRNGFLPDDVFTSLIAATNIRMSGPLGEIYFLVLHGAVEYRDFIGNRYEVRGIWQYNPVEKPGEPIGFYTVALRDIEHPIAERKKKKK